MRKDLVSIITPCYNTGDYVHKLLNSVLNQTYPWIEMIVVDDGSTDTSAEIIKSFIDKFEQRGYALRYILQENSGQSVAIQTALEQIQGEFLVWPDSDDYYSCDEAIQKLVSVLKSAPYDVGMVRAQEIVVADNVEHTSLYIHGLNVRTIEDRALFLDCLLDQNGFYFVPGTFMIKVPFFLRSTKLPIFTSKDAGQNWQMLLPVLFHYRCMSIAEPLLCVVERATSHSRSMGSYESCRNRINTYRETIIGTLERTKDMTEEQFTDFSAMIEKKYSRELFHLALQYDRYDDAKETYRKLKLYSRPTKREKRSYMLLKMNLYGICKWMYSLCNYVR